MYLLSRSLPLHTFTQHLFNELFCTLFIMTRRMTVGSRSELGLLNTAQEFETPSVWSSPKLDVWRSPSRVHYSSPRIKLFGKVSLIALFTFLAYRIISEERQPPRSTITTDQQRIDAANRKDFVWKDFPEYALWSSPLASIPLTYASSGTMDSQEDCSTSNHPAFRARPTVTRKSRN